MPHKNYRKYDGGSGGAELSWALSFRQPSEVTRGKLIRDLRTRHGARRSPSSNLLILPRFRACVDHFERFCSHRYTYPRTPAAPCSCTYTLPLHGTTLRPSPRPHTHRHTAHMESMVLPSSVNAIKRKLRAATYPSSNTHRKRPLCSIPQHHEMRPGYQSHSSEMPVVS